MYIMSKGHIMGAGIVPKDAEFKEFDWGYVCNFAFKGSESKVDGQENPVANWVNVTTRGAVALLAREIQKGDTVLCAGVMQTRKYTNKDGVEKTIKEMKCDFLKVMDKPRPLEKQASEIPEAEGFQEIPDDEEEVPF